MPKEKNMGKKRTEGPSVVVDRKWLSVPQAAEYMSLARSTVYVLMERGCLPVYRPTAGRVFLSRDDIDSYMMSCREMSNEELVRLADQKLLELELRRRTR